MPEPRPQIADLPEGAQKLISNLRKECAWRRVKETELRAELAALRAELGR